MSVNHDKNNWEEINFSTISPVLKTFESFFSADNLAIYHKDSCKIIFSLSALVALDESSENFK